MAARFQISPETTLQSIADAGVAIESAIVDGAALAALDSLGATDEIAEAHARCAAGR